MTRSKRRKLTYLVDHKEKKAMKVVAGIFLRGQPCTTLTTIREACMRLNLEFRHVEPEKTDLGGWLVLLPTRLDRQFKAKGYLDVEVDHARLVVESI